MDDLLQPADLRSKKSPEIFSVKPTSAQSVILDETRSVPKLIIAGDVLSRGGKTTDLSTQQHNRQCPHQALHAV